MAKRKPNDPTTAYAKDVLTGEILAGRMVRQACQRHLTDLETGHERGLRFDVAAAQSIIDFFADVLCLDGDNDKPFVLEPFAQFILGSLFGWKAADGSRRFRVSYCELGKGNAKSPIAAGVGLYGLVADGPEQAAEIYACAATSAQSSVVFVHAKNMATGSDLGQFLSIGVRNIAYAETLSFMRAISSEDAALSGKRVHMALIDEIHEHPSGEIVRKMRAGTKGRRQALIFEITNAGFDRQSICWQHHEYSQKILDGTLQDDSWFAYVCGLDVCAACMAAGKSMPSEGCPGCDDWRNPAVWVKANPCLGVSVTTKYLEEQVREAEGMPANANTVKRLNFCIWTESSVRAIAADRWQACGHGAEPKEWRRRMLEQLRGKQCVGGLDLGSVGDLTALVLIFYQEPKPWPVIPFFWVPTETIRIRSARDRVPYDLWTADGFMIGTEGEITDYDQVRRDIGNMASDYGMEEFAVDTSFQGAQLVVQLIGDGLNMFKHHQGYSAMAAPTKRLLELIATAEIDHGNNPVLAWMAANAATEEEAQGALKFSKRKSTERIDGIVSATMALHVAMGKPEGEDSAEVIFVDY